MKDYDLRLDVPARAYINAQLMSLLEKGGTLWDAKKHLFSTTPYVNAGLDPYAYGPYDHSLVISLLFCTVVVPREFLNLPPNHAMYRAFDTNNALSDFSVKSPKPLNAHAFLRLLRHSVAHALFSISQEDGTLQYSFWTERDPILDASISQEGLIHFLSTVGQQLANAVLEQKRKEHGTT